MGAAAQQRTVAITIDDLPVAHSGELACQLARLEPLTQALLAPFVRRRVPLTAFVIGGRCAEDLSAAERRRILGLWTAAGAEIGNHSHTHPSYTTTPPEAYEADILRADQTLRELTGKAPRYFRSPMLHTGPTPEARDRLRAFLAEKGYQQAPVTLDNADWQFSYVLAHAIEIGDGELERRVEQAYVPYVESVVEHFERRSVEVVGREIAQIHLMHANVLNMRRADELLAMFERRGYRFIALEEALRDPAYELPNDYAGPGGFSWLHRWSRTKGMPNKGEPEPPDWLLEAYERSRRR